jgi:exosortase/archaeosortase family protein
MKLQDFLKRKNIVKFAIIFLVLITIYSILSYFIFQTDPIISLLSSFDNYYLLLAEKTASLFFHWVGSELIIENHSVFLNNVRLDGFLSETLFKKWSIFLLCLFWLTRTSTLKKFLFSILLISISLIFLTTNIIVKAYIVSSSEYIDQTFIPLSLTLGTLFMPTILFLWYRINQETILRSLSNFNINTNFFQNKLPAVISVIYLYIFTVHFLIEYFDFRLWINSLFISSQKILEFLGFKASVEPFYLIGENGSIYMAKGCLGIKTILLFASVVFLTGNDNKKRWVFIFIGILFLNFVNVVRFVLLFIHIQNNSDYVLSMDLHDMYNYIIYAFIFVLWVIWFERFSDIESFTGRSKQVTPKIN